MTNYIFPPKDKTLYGLTTGTVYEPEARYPLLWSADGDFFNMASIAAAEPDGVTDARPPKVGDTINAEEHLNALPDDTILRALYSGEAWQKVDDLLFYRIGSMKEYNTAATSFRGEFTILWMPEGEGEQA